MNDRELLTIVKFKLLTLSNNHTDLIFRMICKTAYVAIDSVLQWVPTAVITKTVVETPKTTPTKKAAK